MSLLFFESFDYLATADITEQWTSDSGISSIGAGGRCGSNAYHNSSQHAGPSIGVTNTNASGFVGAAFKFSQLAANVAFAIQDANGNPFIFCLVNADGSIAAWLGPNTTLGTRLCISAAGLVSQNIYSFIEFGFTLHASAGSVTIRHNGIQVATAAGVKTIPNTFSPIPSLPWRIVHLEPLGYLDDVYICNADGSAPNNTFLGDVHVEALVAVADATAAGHYNQWTPKTGIDHGLEVHDNPPDDDTSYNESGSVGNRDSYRFPALASISGGTIFGMRLSICARKTDDLSSRGLEPVLYIGTNTYDGTLQAISTDYRYWSQVYETNPDTAGAWSVANINALDAGVKDAA